VTGRLLTAREVGELLGLSTETVLRRYRAGELPGFRLASNVLRFDPADVDEWLDNRRRRVAGDRPGS
jgi:excisionase family DNA binding protein